MSQAAGLRTTLVMVLGLTAAPAAAAEEPQSAMEGYQEVAKLHVVDCLLPGQVRRLGNRTYVTPRRPIKTTAADCNIRGGEYTAYDRADYKSALKVWMPAAESGDPEAQTNVGEIFEKGLGDEPNYEAAAHWYQQAAEQGYGRAQFNLGTLYEQGLGVEQNTMTALNWYRQAWGIEEDSVMFASAARREREELERRLEKTVEEKQSQIEVLNQRLRQLEEKLNATTERSADAQAEASTLKTLIAQLEEQRQESEQQLAGLADAAPERDGPRTREPRKAEPLQPQGEAEERLYGDLSLGSYYALLIGNEHYGELEDLETPLSDLRRAEQVLKEKYGFTVFTIADGDNIEVMRAINDLYDIVGPEDNLLIFYAGHGNRLTTGGTETGYWLPSNAEPPPRNTYWVANEFVTGHLSRIKAKRVLVVADSCYAGLLSREPSFLLLGEDGPSYDDMDFLRFKLDKRSRLLLSSGGDRPVLDEGGGEHSVFAKAFFDELENNSELMPSPELFLRVRKRVSDAAADLAFDQAPEFKTIKAAGHEVGDFFFVPADLR
ncbi:MAG: caspase family protein [Gammaproteobacteria bacterium]|nr:caspase family protein [Gammaproteobacteria bacterium]